jgi:hypothetical protein
VKFPEARIAAASLYIGKIVLAPKSGENEIQNRSIAEEYPES